MNEKQLKPPVIGITMLYSGLPEVREIYGSLKDFYMVPHFYVESVVESGGFPLLMPPVSGEFLLKDAAEKVDAFLLIGGPDYPAYLYDEPSHEKNASHERERADLDLSLARHVLATDKPILGICAGAQIMNIALGGKLIQHLTNAVSHTGENHHSVEILPETKLRELFGVAECEINSSHHQAVDPAHVSEELRVTAYAYDGTIEAFELKNHPFRLGLQFHIERYRDAERKKRVFDAFIDAAS